MKTQISIKISSTIFLIPKTKIKLTYFNERKEVWFQWLFLTIFLKLYKRNGREWKPKSNNLTNR